MPILKLTRIHLDGTGLSPRDGHALRGFFANRFGGEVLLHNHAEGGGFRYRYPLVQYKIIEGRAVVLGIGRGGEALAGIFPQLDRLRIGGRDIVPRQKRIERWEAPFGWCPQAAAYRFETPWLGLNRQNHERWQSSAEPDRAALLERVLIGNLLSLAKGLDHRLAADRRLSVRARLEPVPVRFKNRPMIGFKGGFRVNFLIPDGLGLGKSCARGFGTVRRLGTEPSEPAGKREERPNPEPK